MYVTRTPLGTLRVPGSSITKYSPPQHKILYETLHNNVCMYVLVYE